MTRVPFRAARRAQAAIGLALLLFGCAVPASGPVVGYGGPDIGADYYEPFGFAGGWAPSYRVGPYHDDRPYRGRGGVSRGWRAPASRGIPSIPHRAGGARGGGHRGGGARGR